jgi:beta-lactamase regulating signal transducer with metallopeptidase domain
VSGLVDVAAMAKVWLATLGMIAVQGTLLALVAFALTRAGRLRPAWQAAIWLVVTIKFALPWGPAMPWSLSDLIAMLTASHVHIAPLVVTPDLVRVAPAAPSAWPAVGWLALATLWTLGAAVVIVRAVIGHATTARAAARAPLAPDETQSLAATLATAMRVRAPRVVVGGDDVGPHVIGALRPIIVVPSALLADAALLRAALLHELAHVRRRDAIARMVQIVAGAFMWWFPVVRLVQRRLELAREAACDAWALEAGDLPRPAYARLLLRMARLRAVAAPALAQHALDARVASVLGPPARARMSRLNVVVVLGFAALALGGARQARAAHRADDCQYTPQLASALLSAFPTADVDGDGALSRDEACDLQAELRLLPEEERMSRIAPSDEANVQTLLAGPMCGQEVPTCQKTEGTDR